MGCYPGREKNINCINYASKFLEKSTGIITTCNIDKAENTFNCRENRKGNYEIHYYNHWSDFIKERMNFGTTYKIKLSRGIGESQHTSIYKYDSEARLIEENAGELLFKWIKWDSRGRIVKGEYSHKGFCSDGIMEISYDDAENIETALNLGGKDISLKGCSVLPPRSFYHTDKEGNIIIRCFIFDSGSLRCRNYEILEKRKICF